MDDGLLDLLKRARRGDLEEVISGLPDGAVSALLRQLGEDVATTPDSPLLQAIELDGGYVARKHLEHLSAHLVLAEEGMAKGRSARIAVSMPPRSGKSQLASIYLPVWLLRRDATRKIGLISHDPALATSWGRAVRGVIENTPALNLSVAPDAGAASEWQTPERGGVTSRSAPGQSITGRGFKVLIIDDIVKDYAAAHSEVARQAVWDWWLANAQTRLEPPSMVVVIGTRWHEDDFIGRLLSKEHEGDPADWDVISFPAIAEPGDGLGREVGEPLLSPLIPRETRQEAVERWASLERSVGSYNWASQFQQRPAPAQGSIFNMDRFRYWTTDPAKATDDGKVRLIDPDTMVGARWLDSWDLAFKGTEVSDWVVGQRWARLGANRFLIAQVRGRWSFTQTMAQMTAFASTGPWARHSHQVLVEDKANGPAILDVLHDTVPGLKPVTPRDSKEARARAITPECESGNVYLPLPSENPWVADLISELRMFPRGAHDDQVDTFTQALDELREEGTSHISNPADRPVGLPSNARRVIGAARTGVRRSPGG